MVNWESFQAEVGEWAIDNFGEQPAINPFLGTAEEMSELATLFVTFEDIPTEKEKDAIGDMLVFFADFCHRQGISYAKAGEKKENVDLHTDCASIEELCLEVTISRGDQARSVLKQDQGIRLGRDSVGEEADIRFLAHTLAALEKFAAERGFTLDDAVEAAWGEVKEREWDSNYN